MKSSLTTCVGSKTVAHFINLGMTAVFKKVAKNAVS
jgi:hypothetical protein